MDCETAILINVKDRPTELALLMQSLNTQTYKDFDIYVLDDCSGTPLQSYHFFNCLNSILKQNHRVFIKRTEFCEGVSNARQKIVDWVRQMPFKYKYYARLDDDCILTEDYLERLIKVIKEGYALASGVTIPCQPSLKRDPKFLKGIVNRVILDKEGNFIMNGDSCGNEYIESKILLADHFRSCALYKAEIHDKINYVPTPLSWHGFREEQIFSFRLILSGFKIGVDMGAINYHQNTPSGGERGTQTKENTSFNQLQLEEFTKESFLKQHPEALCLGRLLMNDTPFAYEKFSELPGWTLKKCKALHQRFIDGRKLKE